MEMTNIPCAACGYNPGLKTVQLGTLILECELDSGNVIGHNGKGAAGYKYKKARAKYGRAIRLALQNKIPECPHKVKRRVTLVRKYRKFKRRFDDDNLIWGFKPLIDELKAHKLIYEDSPAWLERIYQQVSSGNDFNTIEIIFEEFLDD